MSKAPLFAAAFLAATILTVPSYAKEAKKEAVKPADSPCQAVLAQWNEIGRKLIAMAEDFPEDKYDFKPTPAQRTFAEQLLHASGVELFLHQSGARRKTPASENPRRDHFKSKADIVAYVKKSFADGGAAIKAKGDKGMSDLVVDPYSHQ